MGDICIQSAKAGIGWKALSKSTKRRYNNRLILADVASVAKRGSSVTGALCKPKRKLLAGGSEQAQRHTTTEKRTRLKANILKAAGAA